MPTICCRNTYKVRFYSPFWDKEFMEKMAFELGFEGCDEF